MPAVVTSGAVWPDPPAWGSRHSTALVWIHLFAHQKFLLDLLPNSTFWNWYLASRDLKYCYAEGLESSGLPQGHPAVTLRGHKPLRYEDRAGIFCLFETRFLCVALADTLKEVAELVPQATWSSGVQRAGNPVVSTAVPSHCPGHRAVGKDSS